MGLLDGDLQKIFGGALSGILLDGRHYHSAQTRSLNGDMTQPVIKVQSVKGCKENKIVSKRPQEFTDAQARLIVMQVYDGVIVTPPVRGDRIALDGDWICGNTVEDAAHVAWLIEVTPK